MVMLNAPWNLDEVLREPLRAMAQLLSQERPATWKLDWLLRDDNASTEPKPVRPTRLPPAKRGR
jgi:23S rRNA (adenine2030-N6)-methyltransferase